MKSYFCTECSYVYNPVFGEEEYDIEEGTSFADFDENTWTCPKCWAPKEAFIAPVMEIHEAIDAKNLLDIEEIHIPRYWIHEKGVWVQLGNDYMVHPDEDTHFIEWIGLFDEDGEVVELVKRPNIEEPICFEGYEKDDFYEVRASCSLHGIWKGIYTITE